MGRIRRRHSAAFKAKLALEAARQDKTMSELANQHQRLKSGTGLILIISDLANFRPVPLPLAY